MYGLIGRMRTQRGQRDALIAILLAGTGRVPGCLSYVVAKDPADANGIWITDVWDSQERHKASLALLSVKEAITGRCFPSRDDASLRPRSFPDDRSTRPM